MLFIDLIFFKGTRSCNHLFFNRRQKTKQFAQSATSDIARKPSFVSLYAPFRMIPHRSAFLYILCGDLGSERVRARFPSYV